MRRYTERQMREISQVRVAKCISAYEGEISKKQKNERMENERKSMREVVTFFRENAPEGIAIPNVEIEKVFKKGSKSQYGMILFLDQLVNWPEWKEVALKHFDIYIKTDVELFFIKNMPKGINFPEEELRKRCTITKSTYEVIMLLNQLVDWPEWKDMAFRHFEIT